MRSIPRESAKAGVPMPIYPLSATHVRRYCLRAEGVSGELYIGRNGFCLTSNNRPVPFLLSAIDGEGFQFCMGGPSTRDEYIKFSSLLDTKTHNRLALFMGRAERGNKTGMSDAFCSLIWAVSEMIAIGINNSQAEIPEEARGKFHAALRKIVNGTRGWTKFEEVRGVSLRPSLDSDQGYLRDASGHYSGR